MELGHIRVTVLILGIYIILSGCAGEEEDGVYSDPNVPSIEYVEMALVSSGSNKITSIEYTGATLSKCKYLKDYSETYDFRGIENMSSCVVNTASGTGDKKYLKTRFEHVTIYFPLKGVSIDGSKLTANITTLSHSNFSEKSGELTNGKECYTFVAGGMTFNPEGDKVWHHFLELSKFSCYQPFPSDIIVTINNYKSESCTISFKVKNPENCIHG